MPEVYQWYFYCVALKIGKTTDTTNIQSNIQIDASTFVRRVWQSNPRREGDGLQPFRRMRKTVFMPIAHPYCVYMEHTHTRAISYSLVKLY